MDPPLYPRPRIEYGEKVMIGGGRVKIWIPAPVSSTGQALQVDGDDGQEGYCIITPIPTFSPQERRSNHDQSKAGHDEKQPKSGITRL